MGHINVLANSREELLEKLNHIKTLVRVILKWKIFRMGRVGEL